MHEDCITCQYYNQNVANRYKLPTATAAEQI